MNRSQIALKLVLSELGMDPSMESFDDRLILQKTVYLIQQMGIPLGYHFSWYLRGPYSRDLTADAFANLGSDAPEGWILDEAVESKIAEAKPFLANAASEGNQARELEKLASVLFVINTGQALPHDGESITARMKAAGKDFSRSEVDDAIGVLRERNLI